MVVGRTNWAWDYEDSLDRKHRLSMGQKRADDTAWPTPSHCAVLLKECFHDDSYLGLLKIVENFSGARAYLNLPSMLTRMASGTFCSPIAESSALKCIIQSMRYVTTISWRHLKSRISAKMYEPE